MSAGPPLIGSLGLSVNEARLLELLVQQARSRGAAWSWTGDDDADIVVIDPMVPFTHPTVQRALDTGRPLLVGYRRGQSASRVNTLHINAPGTLAGVLHIIAEGEARLGLRNQHGVRSAKAPSPAPAAGTLPAAAEIVPALPESRLADPEKLATLARFRDLLDEPVGVFAIAFDGTEKLALYLPERIIVARAGILLTPLWLRQELAKARGQVVVREIDDEESVEPHWDNDRVAADLLPWCAAQNLPAGLLLPELPLRARFRLGRWPDFGTLGSSAADFRLAAQLSRAALDLDTLTAQLNGNREAVIRFLNACAACGYLIAHPPATEPARRRIEPAAALGGLMRKLRGAFDRLRL